MRCARHAAAAVLLLVVGVPAVQPRARGSAAERPRASGVGAEQPMADAGADGLEAEYQRVLGFDEAEWPAESQRLRFAAPEAAAAGGAASSQSAEDVEEFETKVEKLSDAFREVDVEAARSKSAAKLAAAARPESAAEVAESASPSPWRPSWTTTALPLEEMPAEPAAAKSDLGEAARQDPTSDPEPAVTAGGPQAASEASAAPSESTVEAAAPAAGSMTQAELEEEFSEAFKEVDAEAARSKAAAEPAAAFESESAAKAEESASPSPWRPSWTTTALPLEEMPTEPTVAASDSLEAARPGAIFDPAEAAAAPSESAVEVAAPAVESEAAVKAEESASPSPWRPSWTTTALPLEEMPAEPTAAGSASLGAVRPDPISDPETPLSARSGKIAEGPAPSKLVGDSSGAAPAVRKVSEGSAVGDPHLQNIYGERFDLMRPGKFVLIQIPRGGLAEDASLVVVAEARRMGAQCTDMYFQKLNITGAWAGRAQHGGLRFDARVDREVQPKWTTFGPVQLKVAHGRTDQGIQYLNVYAKHLGQAGSAVGGLLGEDDHSEVAKPAEACQKTLSLSRKDASIGHRSSASFGIVTTA